MPAGTKEDIFMLPSRPPTGRITGMSKGSFLAVLGICFAGFAILFVVQLINRDRRAIWPALALAALLILVLAIKFGSGDALKWHR
jgi:uncharacterized membrane protein YjjP (DUF1212 family)